MKSPSIRVLALICVATLAAAGCASDRLTGPDADAAAAAAPAAEDTFGSSAVRGGVEKVTICHFPPGNPENMQTITVGAPSVPDHIARHGDFVGVCQSCADGTGC